MTEFIGSRILPECVYHRPAGLAEVLSLMQDASPAVLVAGCTDFIPALRKGVWSYPDSIGLIDLTQVPELTRITQNDNTILIGGATRLKEIVASELIQEQVPLLAQAVQEMASLQVRNSATIGGNLCTASPAADTAPPLLALNAELCLVNSQGQEERLPLTDFFTGPGQTVLGPGRLLKAIHIPIPNKNVRFFRKKMGLRKAFTISVISMALQASVQDATFHDVALAFGAVAPTPMRAPQVEQILEGKACSGELLDRAAALAAETVSPISDVRASAEYRREMAAVFTRRGLQQIMES